MKNSKPKFFATAAHFRKWLEKNHHIREELTVGFYKKASGKPSITWPESVDQALCFGWIDGIRNSLDEESYCIRFTPRKATSHWSNVNIKRMKELLKAGVVHPAGKDAFKERDLKQSGRASYEQKEISFNKEQRQIFKANKQAWTFFQEQAAWYIKAATWWVISAKREETKRARLSMLIRDSQQGLRIKQLRRD